VLNDGIVLKRYTKSFLPAEIDHIYQGSNRIKAIKSFFTKPQ